MKRFLMVLALSAAMASTAQAKTVQDVQHDMGVDKIAHVAAGAVCSLYMSERIMEGKKHRKLITFAFCSTLAFAKEKSDSKSDPKDFLATEIGVVLPLVEFRIEF